MSPKKNHVYLKKNNHHPSALKKRKATLLPKKRARPGLENQKKE